MEPSENVDRTELFAWIIRTDFSYCFHTFLKKQSLYENFIDDMKANKKYLWKQLKVLCYRTFVCKV